MKQIYRTSLDEIREKEKELASKNAQLQQLGFAITEEKVKNAQKDMMISQMGREIANLKVEILNIKGVVE